MKTVARTLADGTLGLAISGEIDLSTAPELEHALEPLLAQSPARIVLDFTDVGFMDSSGLAVLLGAAAVTNIVEIANASPMIRRIVALTGLEGVLRLTP